MPKAVTRNTGLRSRRPLWERSGARAVSEDAEIGRAHSSGLVYMAEDEKQFKRVYPRRHVFIPCRLAWQDYRVSGTTVNVSYTGVAGSLPRAGEVRRKEALIHIPDGIVLRALPVYVQHRVESQRAGFKVVLIEKGQRAWTNLCHVVRW